MNKIFLLKFPAVSEKSAKNLWGLLFTAQSSYASTVLVIVIMSVRLSVTRLLCDETKEHTADTT